MLVLTGVTTPEMLAVAEIQPDLVFESVAELHAAWEGVVGG
jgi:ribonucleotide monophosphatase NagD (HAD superfamily)